MRVRVQIFWEGHMNLNLIYNVLLTEHNMNRFFIIILWITLVAIYLKMLISEPDPKANMMAKAFKVRSLWWFSVGICKSKPGYKSLDLLQIFECSHWLKLQHSDWRAYIVKDTFVKINFPPMQALEFITGHVILNPAYTCKFQLKTP